ncbi:hypothetical protein DFH28DRAFT_970370 [Melampsora americana]|nr:hypothetical protein DFH28DRAFT_970370 [Melampsora americana]
MNLDLETNPFIGFWNQQLINNTGSTARDHLAKDRNWMQWARLSSNLSVLGVLLSLRSSWPSNSNPNPGRADEPISIIFFVVSILSILVGLLEYSHVHSQMSQNKVIAHSSP